MTALRTPRRHARPHVRVALVALLALLGTLVVQAPASSATTYSLAVSTSPTRAGAGALEGATLHGVVHPFTTPDTDVRSVRFFLDDPDRLRTPAMLEGGAPFDLGGTNKDGTARPYDTRRLTTGAHTLTAELTLRSGAVHVVHAGFRVDQASARLVATPTAVTLKAAPDGPPATGSTAVTAADGASVPVTATSSAPWLAVAASAATTPATLTLTADPRGLAVGTHTASVAVASSAAGYPGTTVAVTLRVVSTSDYAVLHSAAPGRTAPAELAGATIAGPLYAFTGPDDDVDTVRFFLDDPDRRRAPLRTEGGAPYDLAGSSKDGLALPFDTTSLTDGEHTLTAEVTTLAGVVTVRSATFRTANAAPRLVLSAGSLALTSDGSAPVSGAVSLDAADAGAASFTAASDRPWLTVRADRSTTPAVLAVSADPAGLADGAHTGTVTVSAPGLRSATLAVRLTVAQPAAAMAFTPGTLSLSSDGAGAVSTGATLSASPTAATFSLTTDVPWLTASPGSGTTPSSLTVTADPAGLGAGGHAGTVVATATDGRTARLPVTLTVKSDTCSPVACEDVRVDLPHTLVFSENVGGVVDRAGLGTGFTHVDPPSAGKGYLPANLALDPLGSVLRVTTTAGLASGASDTQDNALAVGIDAPSQVTLVKTTVVAPPKGSGKFEQAGIWFGNGEDDYDKLVITSTTSGTQLEHTTEVGGVLVKTVRSSVQDLAASRVELVLRADPVAKTVTAFWSADGGAQTRLGAHTVPGEFFSFDAAGIDPRIGTRSFGGILTSHRHGATPRTYAFDDFTVEQAPATGGGGGSAGPSAAFAFDRSSSTVRWPTAMVFGPDGRLYVSEMFGKIHALTIGADRRVVADQVIGTLGARLTLGLTVDPASTASDVVLWVSHSSPSADDGEVNSSTVTRLSGPTFAERRDVITGLPRAKANHAVNALHFGPDGRLFIAMGGSTGAGAPNVANTEFGDRPEQPLSAALLVADVKAAGFSGACATPLHAFGVPSTCDVRTFATGLRNMYDFTFHSNGEIYGSDNGLGVTGSYPPRPAADCTGLADAKVHNPGDQPDSLRRLTEGSYHGHPNPYRNECVFGSGAQQGVPALPAYTPRMHSLGSNKSANGTVEYRGDAFCGALRGDLLIANYSSGDDITRVRLSADGRSVVGSEQLVGGFADPLPLTVGPDGTIWVGEFGGDRVTALVPRDQGCWSTRAPLPADLLDVGGTALDGLLHVVGGKSAQGYSTVMHVFDPATDRWSTAPGLPQAVENPAVTAHGGRLWAFGGSTAPFSGAVTNGWVYDPAARSWTALPAMPTARSGAVAQVVGGRIVVAGGMGADGASVATVEAFDPSTGTWSTLAPMATRRDNPGAAVLDGRLLVFGGRTREASGATTDGTLATVESYDPATGQWTARAPMPTGRRTMVVAALGGRALVMGGEVASDGAAFAANEEYDPVTDTWRRLTPMPTGRHGAAAGVVDGTVYVVAGGPRGGGSYSGLLEAFRFGRP